MNVLASCSSYVLGCVYNQKGAANLISAAVADEREKAPIPAVVALRKLRYLCDLQLRVDGGATHIAKTRSRHFYEALQSGADVWLTIDDDVDASEETLRWLLEAVDESMPAKPRLCVVPCALRDQPVANVRFTEVYYSERLSSGGIVRSIEAAGFALVAMNREALIAIADESPTFLDDDGIAKPAPFFEVMIRNKSQPLAPNKWLGEDLSFFKRLPRDKVTATALVTGQSTHAGATFDLGQLA